MQPPHQTHGTLSSQYLLANEEVEGEDEQQANYGVAGVRAAPVVAEVLVQGFLAVEAGGRV